MKTKYAVCKETFEFDQRNYATTEEAYWDLIDHDQKQIDLFDSIEDARSSLKDVDVCTNILNSHLARATVAFIEEGTYDMGEDGEWEFVSGSNVFELKYEYLY